MILRHRTADMLRGLTAIADAFDTAALDDEPYAVAIAAVVELEQIGLRIVEDDTT